MAYRFDGVDDRVQFAIAPFNGYTFGPATCAIFLKRTTLGSNDRLIDFSDQFQTDQWSFQINFNDPLQVFRGSAATGPSISSSSTWYLIVATWPTGTFQTVRYHVHDGTSWSHTNSSGTIGSTRTPTGTWTLNVGAKVDGTVPFPGDIVCVGIKKADSNDASVETLSRTSWPAWTAFGFEWLIGFDSSLETAGILQDQGSVGTGDENAITGTTAVSDPPGWSWSGAPPPSTFVPQVIVVS